MKNKIPREYKLAQKLINTFSNQLKDLEEKLDDTYSHRDEAIAEGKFDLVFELNRSVNHCLEIRDSILKSLEKEKSFIENYVR